MNDDERTEMIFSFYVFTAVVIISASAVGFALYTLRL